MDDEARAVIKDLAERLELLERCVAGLIPAEVDPLEANHEAFMAGPVAAARAREAQERGA